LIVSSTNKTDCHDITETLHLVEAEVLVDVQIPAFQGPPGTGFAISSINNSTVNFYFQSK
jgi:hypothetical protein